MSEHRWSRLRFSPLRLTTAAVFGSIDCALRFHSASSTTPPRRFGCRYVPQRHLRSVTARGASLHLRLQTIFTLPFPLYPRHLRLRLRCRVRSHSSVPRNLRLLFRPVRTGICSPSSNRRTAAIRATILPPIRGLMNARRLARGTRSFLALSGSMDLTPRAGM